MTYNEEKEFETERKFSGSTQNKKEENLMESLIEDQHCKNIKNAYSRLPDSEEDEEEMIDSEHSFLQMNKTSVMNNSDVSTSNRVRKWIKVTKGRIEH